MATVIRAKISEKNKYWIDKHRHYELKHFCLQYPEWKRAVKDLDGFKSKTCTDGQPGGNNVGDPTSKCVEIRTGYIERIKMVERIAAETDEYLADYILRAVTENLSFTYLSTQMNIPCSRDTYYDRYRKFFWLLSKARN